MVPASWRVLTLLVFVACAIYIARRRLPLDSAFKLLLRLVVLVQRLRARRHAISLDLGSSEGRTPLMPRWEVCASPSLAEVAFDYERAVLGLSDVGDETKNRVIFLVTRVILPLVGQTRLADVTVEFEQGTCDVLAEYEHDPRGAVYVWRDLLRWARVNCVRRPARRQGGPYRTISDID